MGRNPDRDGIIAVGRRWRKPYKFHMHNSICIIFCFDTIVDHDHVLGNAWYFACGSSLFLKMMLSYFLFDEDGHFVLACV